jgi:rhodanese-related sulfurtransferase
MKRRRSMSRIPRVFGATVTAITVLIVMGICMRAEAQSGPTLPDVAKPSYEDAVVPESSPGPAPQISTAELRRVLAHDTAVLIDARPPDEYAMSHIPNAVNVSPKPGVPISVYVSDVEEVKRLIPDLNQMLVLYCNGPFCGKSKRLAAELSAAGYTSLRRYQMGMPAWRLAGGATVIEDAAIRRVAKLDNTAVLVDAGLLPHTHTFPKMTRILLDEVAAAKEDGRLPMNDHNTRIVVIGIDAAQALGVAQQIQANAFHNVTYFDGSGASLRCLGLRRTSREVFR